jgi:hypothetical protein
MVNSNWEEGIQARFLFPEKRKQLLERNVYSIRPISGKNKVSLTATRVKINIRQRALNNY